MSYFMRNYKLLYSKSRLSSSGINIIKKQVHIYDLDINKLLMCL